MIAMLPANMRVDVAPKDQDKTLELLSPTASLRFAGSGGSSTTIKWKSSVESTVNSIKSNPLAENNVTFGSTPLLRPAILEKPLFLKIGEQKKPNEALPSPSEVIVAPAKTTRKSKQEKLEKEREKSREVECEKPLSPVAKKAIETSTSAELQKEEQKEIAANGNSTSNVNQTASSAVETVETPVAPENLKRQRIDLKGPRVKHVCRSASIVLGQPLATFGDELEEEEMTTIDTEVVATKKPTKTTVDTEPILTDENENNCASCKLKPEEIISNPNPQVNETKSSKSHVQTEAKKMTSSKGKVTTRNAAAVTAAVSTTTTGILINKKQRNMEHHNHTSSGASNQTARRALAKEVNRLKTLISIDFWENYDPAEVCQTGFGLIVTETVAQRALCFLCGSTGLDPLIFCACCCEPYHQYCVLDEYNLKQSSFDDTLMNSLLDNSTTTTTTTTNGGTGTTLNQLTQRLNWLCPRCTVCYTCNMSSGSKVKCQKCQKNYHSTCLGTSKRLLGADRPLICVNCLKCKSCATTKVSKFVGNLPMCTACFKLRKRATFVPFARNVTMTTISI